MFKLSIHVHPCHPLQQKTGKISMPKLHNSINILHIPITYSYEC